MVPAVAAPVASVAVAHWQRRPCSCPTDARAPRRRRRPVQVMLLTPEEAAQQANNAAMRFAEDNLDEQSIKMLKRAMRECGEGRVLCDALGLGCMCTSCRLLCWISPTPYSCSPPCPPHRPALPRPAVPSKGGRRLKDPTASSVPDPAATPSAKEFEKNNNFGVVTAW